MDKRDPEPSDDGNNPDSDDLAGRLARYRRRVEAEGRKKSLRVLDRAIREAKDK